MSKPHINLMDRGDNADSIDYELNPMKELLSTCPCDSCLDLYRKIQGKNSPQEYRTTESADINPKPAPVQAVYNTWTCPSTQAYPDEVTLEIIRRAPWKLGQTHHGTPEHPIDIDESGHYFLKGSIEHHFRQFTGM
jgi:hypothetical protein